MVSWRLSLATAALGATAALVVFQQWSLALVSYAGGFALTLSHDRHMPPMFRPLYLTGYRTIFAAILWPVRLLPALIEDTARRRAPNRFVVSSTRALDILSDGHAREAFPSFSAALLHARQRALAEQDTFLIFDRARYVRGVGTTLQQRTWAIRADGGITDLQKEVQRVIRK